MCSAMAAHRNRNKHALKGVACKNYELNQDVIIFNPHKKLFCEAGTIQFFVPISDRLGPQQFMVQMANGSSRVINSAWLSPQSSTRAATLS